jgi:hypothetical protein
VRATTEPPDEDLTATRRHLQAAPNSTGKVVHIHQATVNIPEDPTHISPPFWVSPGQT